MEGRDVKWICGWELETHLGQSSSWWAFQVVLAMVFGGGKRLKSFKPETDLIIPTFSKCTLLSEQRIIWSH